MVLMINKQMVVLGQMDPNAPVAGDLVSKEIRIGETTCTKVFERSPDLNFFRPVLRKIDEWRGYRNITAEIEGKFKEKGVNPDATLSAIRQDLRMIKYDPKMNQAGVIEIKLKEDANSVENFRQIFRNKDVLESLVFKSQESMAPGALKDLAKKLANRDCYRSIESDVRFVESMRSLPLDQRYTKSEARAVKQAIIDIKTKMTSAGLWTSPEKEKIERIFNEIQGRISNNLIGKDIDKVVQEAEAILFPGKAQHFPVDLNSLSRFLVDVRSKDRPNFNTLYNVLRKLPNEWKNFSVEARQEMRPPFLRLIEYFLESEKARSDCEDLPGLTEALMYKLRDRIQNDTEI